MTTRDFLPLLASFLVATAASAQDVLVRGEIVYPVSAPAIHDGAVLVRDGRIAAVGPAAEIEVPDGIRVLEGRVVTPGLVDAHSTVGVSGILNADLGSQSRVRVHDQDQLDTTDPIQAELRAVDAYDARDPLVEWIRDLGITTVHTGHGPGALVSGQTMIVKTRGETVEQAVIVPEAMLAMSLGPSVIDNFDSPGTRAAGVARLRQELLAAQEYGRKRSAASEDPEKKAPDLDLGHETLVRLLDGELKALVTVHRHHDIAAALRLAEEMGFEMILDGVAEASEMLEEIREAGIPVVIHPTMARPSGETRNVSFETAATLSRAGIPLAFQSGHEPYVPKIRVVLFEAAVAVAHGLPFDEALEAVTLGPARILGIDDRVGSLEAGKDGDLAIFDGDPFETISHVCGVVIEGEVVSETCR